MTVSTRTVTAGSAGSGEPVTARVVAERAAPKLAKDGDEAPSVDAVLSRVSKALGRLKRDGTVASVNDGTGVVMWGLRA